MKWLSKFFKPKNKFNENKEMFQSDTPSAGVKIEKVNTDSKAFEIDLTETLSELISQSDLNTLIEKHEKRSITPSILGHDNSTTIYAGTQNDLVGLTNWIDRRNNKEYQLKTLIKIEVYGSKKFKDYFYISTINGKEFGSIVSAGANKQLMVEHHSFHLRLAYSRMAYSFLDNPKTDFADIF